MGNAICRKLIHHSNNFAVNRLCIASNMYNARCIATHHRANAINRVEGIPTGVGDIGLVRYRAPLKLDVSRVRNGPEVVSAVNANPLMASQNLRANADNQEEVLSELLSSM
jgi:hypothetical protein